MVHEALGLSVSKEEIWEMVYFVVIGSPGSDYAVG